MSLPTFGPPHAPYLPDRIRLRLVVTETSPGVFCWLWTGERNERGYGRISANGKHARAHRVTFAAYGQTVPDGMHLGHLCHDAALAAGACDGGRECVHRACANPAHLAPVSPSLNAQAGARARRDGLCVPRRHRITDVGLYVRPDGTDECRGCKREAAKR